MASWTGKGAKSTEKFTVGDEWKIVWDTKPGEFGAMNFQIFIYDESGGLAGPGVAANVIGADADETMIHKAGTFYLEFNTAQPYAVSVWEYR